MNTHIFTLVLTVLASLSVSSQTSQLRQPLSTAECANWVDSVYNTLNEEERIAQLIVSVASPSQGAASRTNIKELVDKYHVGGIFLSKGSAAQFAEMTSYAQGLSKVPLLMGIDGEWGVAMRVTDAEAFPYNMGLGAIQDPTLLYRYGEATARQCRALGVSVDFSPVLDVNSNPNNPVIGYRSFGEDPNRVATLGRAYSLGLESCGVMAVGKHFPGHGDTDSDSHKTLPTINHDRNTLNSVDLLPFKTFIEAGCSGIMVGHLSVPSIDKSGKAASMSYPITTGLLCKELGFDGMIFTDGLEMKGASTKENICVAALKAGADVLLSPVNISAGIAAVKKAVAEGEIPAIEIEKRCKKMLAYKYALGLTKPIIPDAKNIISQINSEQTLALIQELADASITAVHNHGNILPIGDLSNVKIAVVNIGDGDNVLTEYCRKYAPVDIYCSKEAALTPKQIDEIKKHDIVIAAVYNDSQNARNTMAALKDIDGLIPAMMMNAYKTSKFSTSLNNADALILAYGNSKYLQQATAKAIFGGIDVNGKLPVNIKGIGNLGEGVTIMKSRLGYASPVSKGLKSDLTHRMDSAVNAAMKSGAFTGAQLLVVKGGDIIVDRNYGYTTNGGSKVTGETLFDLASVSKAVGTLPGIMKAYDLGLFDLDAPIASYIEDIIDPDKIGITARMLLHHETGLPATLNMYSIMMDSSTYSGRVVSNKRDKNHTIAITGGGYGHNTAKIRRDITSATKSTVYSIEAAKGIYLNKAAYDTIMSNIYKIKVKPSRSYVYSCLNFCLLMDMEQRLTGQQHENWITDSIWAPIGAYSLCYRPIESVPLSRIVATEQDTYLRKQHVHGYVHDEIAAFSGGIQGNAGVFGNATDIAKICQLWLNQGSYGGIQIFRPETTALFTTEKSNTCRRGLGFDKPDKTNKDKSPTCDEASAATYGHTGFTGTCFWVDPEADLIFVFLCNRINPSRSNKAFSSSKIRPTLMSMVYDAMRP